MDTTFFFTKCSWTAVGNSTLGYEMTSKDDTRSGDGWQVWISDQAPVEGEGTIDGHPWTFSARGTAWAVNIAERSDQNPEHVGITVGGWSYWGHHGENHEASWMHAEEAWALIRGAFDKYRRGEIPFCPPKPRE